MIHLYLRFLTIKIMKSNFHDREDVVNSLLF